MVSIFLLSGRMLSLFFNRTIDFRAASRASLRCSGIAKAFDMPEHRKLALEAARKSIVLLKNKDNILPLNKNIDTIAIIGPNADVQRNLLGDYTYPAHIEITILAAEAKGATYPPQE